MLSTLSSEETSPRWRAVGDTVSDLPGAEIEPRSPATIAISSTTTPTSPTYVEIFQDLNRTNNITSDGDEQLMFNGISDWLFSIEITDDDALLWWSEDGDYLAFAK